MSVRHHSNLRGGTRAVLVVSLACIVALGALLSPIIVESVLDRRHQQQVDRIATWVNSAFREPPPGETPSGWHSVHSCIGAALANDPICYRKVVPTEKIRDLADELDRTHGEELKSRIGMMRFVTRLEKICPPDRVNDGILQLRAWQQDGELPTPPEELPEKK